MIEEEWDWIELKKWSNGDVSLHLLARMEEDEQQQQHQALKNDVTERNVKSIWTVEWSGSHFILDGPDWTNCPNASARNGIEVGGPIFMLGLKWAQCVWGPRIAP